MRLVGPRSTSVPRRKISPPGPTSARSALREPACEIRPAWMPIRPPSAISLPRFTASPAGAVTVTRRAGLAVSASCTLRPAASRISPCGEVMTPLFSSRGAISSTWPPLAVVIWPSWTSAPADAGPAKLSRPARKSASPRSRVEATRPPTSIRAPWPKTIPFGLIRNTRPFDCSRPSRLDGSWPTTRLRTALLAFCWTKRVSSSGAIEKPCQLMIVPGALVTVSVLPLVERSALPATTFAPVGLASALPPNAHSSANARAVSLGGAMA